MTLVHAETGEVVAHCTPDEARELTERIRSSAEALWSLLAEAHDKQAYAALGYETFRAYVETEFGMSKRHAYRLLDQATVIQEVEDAAGVTRGSLVVSEREARDLKPHLDEVKERVAAAVEADRIGDPAEVARETVTQIREEKRTEVERPDRVKVPMPLAHRFVRAMGPLAEIRTAKPTDIVKSFDAEHHRHELAEYADSLIAFGQSLKVAMSHTSLKAVK